MNSLSKCYRVSVDDGSDRKPSEAMKEEKSRREIDG
jgi:hypothetical protein